MAPEHVHPIRIPLSQLLPGQSARVDCSTLSGIPDSDRCLLAAMGLADRCKVKRCAGKLCIIQVDSTRIALGSPLADQVLVEPITDPASAA